MGRIRSSLTYSNVISTLCLFALLGGGAYAANHYVITSTDQIKPSVLADLTGGKRDSAVTAKKKKAKRGPAGPQGPPGPAGANGANGADGTARAYASVTGSGVASCTPACDLDPDHSKGVSNVTYGGFTGIYCVNAPGIDSATVPAVATVREELTAGGSGAAVAAVDTNASECPSGQFQVRTYQDGDVSNDVAFIVLIP